MRLAANLQRTRFGIRELQRRGRFRTKYEGLMPRESPAAH